MKIDHLKQVLNSRWDSLSLNRPQHIDSRMIGLCSFHICLGRFRTEIFQGREQ